MGRHGSPLGASLLQTQYQRQGRRPPGVADGGPPQPLPEPGQGRRDLLRDLPGPGPLLCPARRPQPLRLRKNHGGRPRRRRGGHPRRSGLRGIRPPPLGHPQRRRGPGRHAPDAAPPAPVGPLLHHDGRGGPGQDDEGGDVFRDENPGGRRLDRKGLPHTVHAARRTGRHPLDGALRGAEHPLRPVPRRVGGGRRRRHPRGRDHEERHRPEIDPLFPGRPGRWVDPRAGIRRPDALRGPVPVPGPHENTNLGTAGARQFRLCGRIDSGQPRDLQVDVDLQDRLRRIRQQHPAPQQVVVAALWFCAVAVAIAIVMAVQCNAMQRRDGPDRGFSNKQRNNRALQYFRNQVLRMRCVF
mmetsp:Transcript_20676/g.43223  ORF Transcript_20676/g.43223 Transcript_20676/m.43223 type:complete len:355 (+) Transcript_20676:413-1477(+)